MRKLMMLAASAFAALAFAGVWVTTAAASEPFGVYTADWEMDPCPEVSLDDGEVSGGCLTEGFEGSFDLGVFVPQWYLMGVYGSTFDLALDASGAGYAVDPTVATSAGPGRVACDEGDGTVLPWPVEARAPNASTFELDITVGLRTTGSGPGGMCIQQEITVQMSEVGSSTLPSPGTATELDQAAPSANIANGYWVAPSLGMWVVI